MYCHLVGTHVVRGDPPLQRQRIHRIVEFCCCDVWDEFRHHLSLRPRAEHASLQHLYDRVTIS